MAARFREVALVNELNMAQTIWPTIELAVAELGIERPPMVVAETWDDVPSDAVAIAVLTKARDRHPSNALTYLVTPRQRRLLATWQLGDQPVVEVGPAPPGADTAQHMVDVAVRFLTAAFAPEARQPWLPLVEVLLGHVSRLLDDRERLVKDLAAAYADRDVAERRVAELEHLVAALEVESYGTKHHVSPLLVMNIVMTVATVVQMFLPPLLDTGHDVVINQVIEQGAIVIDACQAAQP